MINRYIFEHSDKKNRDFSYIFWRSFQCCILNKYGPFFTNMSLIPLKINIDSSHEEKIIFNCLEQINKIIYLTPDEYEKIKNNDINSFIEENQKCVVRRNERKKNRKTNYENFCKEFSQILKTDNNELLSFIKDQLYSYYIEIDYLDEKEKGLEVEEQDYINKKKKESYLDFVCKQVSELNRVIGVNKEHIDFKKKIKQELEYLINIYKDIYPIPLDMSCDETTI